MQKSVSQIIEELQSNPPTEIPVIKKASQSDLEELNQYFRKGDKTKLSADSLIVLKIVDSELRKLLKKPDYLKPLIDINYSQTSKFVNEARVKLCENIIEYQEIQRLATVDFHLNALEVLSSLEENIRARMALVRAGRYAMAGQFLRASTSYLDAIRREGFVNDDEKKRQIIELAIAYAFLTPENPETHKVICALYLHQMTKTSRFTLLVEKLYTREMVSVEEVTAVGEILPRKLKQQDNDGVSALSKATFSHNMTSLMKSFSSISFDTAVELIGITLEQLFVLIEKTYKNREVLIDQVSGYLYLHMEISPDDMIMEFLQMIDGVVQ